MFDYINMAISTELAIRPSESSVWLCLPQGFSLVVRVNRAMCGLGACHWFEPCCRQMLDIWVERVEGWAHYSPSFELCATSSCRLIGYKKKKRSSLWLCITKTPRVPVCPLHLFDSHCSRTGHLQMSFLIVGQWELWKENNLIVLRMGKVWMESECSVPLCLVVK